MQFIKFVQYFFLSIWVLVGIFVISYNDMRLSSKICLINAKKSLPNNFYFMILGSGKRYYVEPNYAYNGRISSGIYLWKKYPNHSFILTGIKYGDYYNEPFEMKTDLLNAGIPDSILISDSTSYDTFDSIKWFKKNFDQQKVVIISQREHLQRALWLAQEVGISALGYEAENIPSIGFVDYTFREIISCMKARIEVGIYKTKCLVSKQ